MIVRSALFFFTLLTLNSCGADCQWHDSPEGRFRVCMPGVPTEGAQPITVAGRPSTIKWLRGQLYPSALVRPGAYLVGYVDIDSGDPDKAVADLLAKIARDLGGVIGQRRIITTKQASATEAEIAGGDKLVRTARIYAAGSNRLYALVVIENCAWWYSRRREFFDSFAVTGATQ